MGFLDDRSCNCCLVFQYLLSMQCAIPCHAPDVCGDTQRCNLQQGVEIAVLFVEREGRRGLA
ncbi:hypothetical protein MUK42_35061 [Musa troglodytarum]|uniref:Uncharacterized protein n=1 Tax=Musa troglodytarum TaxID=320322 RepID=A0A9E7JBY6_9LILI|nr:hypothetical protein MUK42_35061 [Musa troglodytarum]